jgi:periplasmic divalent cation tolerance protein
MTLVTLTLSCKDLVEANTISHALLEHRLIACAKTSPIESVFLWKGQIEKAAEVLLTMESTLENFAAIEAIVKELHSYELFVLQAYPILKASQGVEEWVSGIQSNTQV